MPTRRRAIEMVAFAILVIPALARADTGVWVATGEHPTSIGYCLQAYTCEAAHPMMYSADSKLVATDSQVAFGTCAVGGGDPSACAACLTTPPTLACTITVVPK